ncbi:2-aminoethylphosphonate aminotransferase [Salinisphaera sp.]|uniref:2-aminoethylphosphonate aminotransferase n=1 Tax=Salinisphaera sp. TaxID=1914330 RepID=UPI002D7A390A|nr:2-aminoethylphosphonate aminotransferase [Salinisphaera sp.]HET7312973.1 2-aminoethylphosphonate aminotransferase [Salinisphaera sp.]
MRLLNPGPVTLTPRVRAALAAPDLCHREAEFFDLQDEIRARLIAVYGLDPATWAPIVLSGSGTAAVEAMMSSMPGENARVLVIENGVYGERMTQMAAVHGIDHDTLRLGWGEEIDTAALAARLAGARFTHVAVVHHETTTGRLNDLEAIAEVCAKAEAALLVDAVSSFGAEAIEFAPAVAAVAATANKCLHGAPGAAFVIARRSALAKAKARALYLDLVAYGEKQDARGTPFTPAVPAFHALAAALAEHAEAGGWPARRAHYRALAGQVADGLAALGIDAVLDGRHSSCVLRSYRLPSGVSYDALHDRLKAAGFVIYAGQGDLAGEIFRISTMGDLDGQDMECLIIRIAEITAR